MIWHYGFPKVFIRHYAGIMGFLNKALFGTMYFPYGGVLGRVLSRAHAGVGPNLGRAWARSRSGPSLGPGPVLARAATTTKFFGTPDVPTPLECAQVS
jgi:hypothetical protein